MTVNELREALANEPDPDAQVMVVATDDHSLTLRIVHRSIQLGVCVERVVGLEVHELPRQGVDCAECERLRNIIEDARADLEGA